MGDIAAMRAIRQQSLHLFEHFKSEIERDNTTNKYLYDRVALLAEATSSKSSTVPYVTETLVGIEGIMSKLRFIIELHIDISLREISKNLKLMCKEQAELMDKVLVEMRSSLWFYIFSLNSVYNCLRAQHSEKQIYAEKSQQLARTVTSLTATNEKIESSESLIEMLDAFYSEGEEASRALAMSGGKIAAAEEGRSKGQSKGQGKGRKELTEKEKQVLLDSEIHQAIQIVDSNPGLSEEDKEFRRAELLKSRRTGHTPADGCLTAKYGNAGRFVETVFVPGHGFMERINARRLEKFIRELQVRLGPLLGATTVKVQLYLLYPFSFYLDQYRWSW